MFDKSDEGKFKARARVKVDDVGVMSEEIGCTQTEDVKKSIRASFKFIKDNPIIEDGKVLNAHITLGVFLTKSQDSTKNEFDYGLTEVDGVVKDVCDSYVVLKAVNSSGQEFEVKVIYEDMVTFWHLTIYRNFEAYVNYINSEVPPLCKDLASESYNLLVKIAKILGRNMENERNFVFILNRVLTRRIKAEGIAIIRNLIVVDELFVDPITSIQGFSQVPNK